MARILRTTRRLATETVAISALEAEFDGQGMPTFASPIEVAAHVVVESSLVERPGGSMVKADVTIYVPGDEQYLGKEGDLVSIDDDEREFEVLQATRPRGLKFARALPDHSRLRCGVATEA